MIRLFTVLGLTVVLSGCVLAPREAKHEAVEMRVAGAPYRQPFAERDLPEVPSKLRWEDVLRRALLANGDLESAYYDWAAAVHRIQQAGGYPNTPLSTSFSYMFSGGDMKAFDRTTVNVGPDAMENLAFPPKVYQAAKVALDEARAAGKRFVATKFDVQERVLTAWLQYALLAERIRIQRENVSLLKLISDTAVNRVQAGAQQQDLIRAETEYRLADNELKNLEAQLPQQRATLNAMMAREPDAPLEPPDQIPPARPVPLDDAALLALAAETNPELAALGNLVRGRENALELAKLQYIPDFNPFAGFTGTVSQMIGVGISIPTFLPEVRGRVKEARADLRGMMAMYRQTRFDTAAQVVAALYALRNSERQAELFENQIIPAAERVLDLSRQGYAAGTGPFLDLVESQRTLLDVRLGLAEARATREELLADLEELLGVDMEAIAPANPEPEIRPIASGPGPSASANYATPERQ
ncbi:MAG TPA: TolC family protein [Tepidisphaeraceae bacterium]|nr:TolC family protein [Tepidisphaeraceae bacterium]